MLLRYLGADGTDSAFYSLLCLMWEKKNLRKECLCHHLIKEAFSYLGAQELNIKLKIDPLAVEASINPSNSTIDLCDSLYIIMRRILDLHLWSLQLDLLKIGFLDCFQNFIKNQRWTFQ